MFEAPVGDDVYGEDPSVIALEERVAAMFGKERALFVPTGVMANQLAIATSAGTGEEVVVGRRSHIFNYETAAPSILSGVQLHTVEDPEGRIEEDRFVEAIREDVYYMPRTALIAHENTHNRTSGRIVPIDHLRQMYELASSRGIATHLDGARLFNAMVAAGIDPSDVGSVCDTLSICLSKGLGAPVGSVLVADNDRIDRAWKLRKAWGGGWRQAGILAAAGMYALDNHVDRLAEDHRSALRFFETIESHPSIAAGSAPETNIVVFGVPSAMLQPLLDRLADDEILLSAAFLGTIRAVFHLDVSSDDAVAAGERLVAHVRSLEGTS